MAPGQTFLELLKLLEFAGRQKFLQPTAPMRQAFVW
jgi:hypothetical protein